MIDYTKILIKNPDIDSLLTNVSLTFYREFSEETGEYKQKRISNYHFCKIVICDSGTVFFNGSIHKFWNSINGKLNPYFKGNYENYKGYNGNDFTLTNFYEVKAYLQELFNCKPEQMIFKNIEVGVNINIDLSPSNFLKGLLYHKGKLFENKFNRSYFQVKHQQYILKLYDKGKQYNMPNNVLRVELKFVRMKELNSIEIFTLEDVNNLTLIKAKEVLLRRFDEIIHYDYTVNKNKLTNREKEALKNYKNSSYWIDDLKPQHRDRHKKKLQEIIEKHSKNLQKQIRELILKKCVIINQ